MDKEVLALIQWTIGICATGFMFLAGWIFWLVQRIKERPTFSEMRMELAPTVVMIKEIRDALLGDMDHEGLISRARRRDEWCIIHKLLKKKVEEPMGNPK